MKRNVQKSALAIFVIAALLSFGLVATAAILNVPDTYGTITEALAAAKPGDTISVSASYGGEDSDGLPILVQVDNLTITGDVTITGEADKAVFVVGAKKIFDPETGLYKPVTVSDVTIDGFTITGGDIGVLIKNADNVTVKNVDMKDLYDEEETLVAAVPYEGVRIMDSSTNCTIDNVKVYGAGGIGFFLEEVSGNELINSSADGCALGVFDFESANGNTIIGGSFLNNGNGGIVVNDSAGTTISKATIERNTGWGVRFVFASGGGLFSSKVEDNTWGGVELIGSTEVVVDGNIVYNNGTADDDSDDAQIVITKGDKAIFTTDVFADYPGEDFEDFVVIKHTILDKLDLLEWWFDDLKIEVAELIQKTATAIGKIDSGAEDQEIIDWIDKIIYEKHYICNPQTASSSGLEGVLTREFWEEDPDHRPAGIEDPNNFTLEGSTHPLTVDLEDYADLGLDFGLTYDVDTSDVQSDSDEISWDKLRIMDIVLTGIRREVYNEDPELADLKQILSDMEEKGLITANDLTDLNVKLEAVLGYVSQLDVIVDLLIEGFKLLDVGLEAAKLDLLGEARDILLVAKGALEAYFVADGISADYLDLIDIIRYKLCLVDLEVPRTPEINSDLVGKKEKPFLEITDEEETTMKEAIVDALNVPGTAQDVLEAVKGVATWSAADHIQVEDNDVTCSTRNTISSNLISTDLLTTDRQIGIVIECPHNAIVNNVITNEAVKPIDDETHYGEFHRLDVAMILLADECLLAYNTIEWVDNGIIRGGTWIRDDYQTEYVFEKLTEAAYWPEPGWPEPGNPDADRLCCTNPWTLQDTCYKADHFDQRPVAWVPVLSVKSEKVEEVGFTESQRVKRNRISLNFFEHVGVTIDILDAESNTIDENLFYNCANGIKLRAPGIHPWYPDYPDCGGFQIAGAGPNIVLKHNDYYSGVAVDNQTTDSVNAGLDYTLPEGTFGHATVYGKVNPPAAGAPWSYENFLEEAKFLELAGWALTRMVITIDMDAFRWNGLAPNLSFFYEGVVLPEEKPRHPSDIFEQAEPVCLSETFPAGWNLVSVPVYPVNPDPAAVFGDDVPFLYMHEWNGDGYVTPTEIKPFKSYWIWLMNETTLDVCGIATQEDVTFELGDAGWHMVSTPTICVYWQYVEFKLGEETKNLVDAVAAGWLRPFFFPYNVALGAYETLGADPADQLCPWPGYWIKSLEDELEIVLPIAHMLTNPPEPPDTMSPMTMGIMGDEPPAPPAPPRPASVADLVVMNTPNPIRDVHTTTFRVMGGFVEGMRVRIFDQAGRMVFEDESAGNELTWHTENLAGEYLANGVYLYQVEVKIAGQWTVTEVKKLAIYR
jgi:parallel beta-helix repeat protein